MDKKLLAVDQFYSLHELFKHCASSENQFINLLDEQLSVGERLNFSTIYDQDYEELGLTQTNIIYFKDILERRIEYLLSIVDLLERRRSQTLLTDPELQRRSQDANDDVLRIFKFVLRRAQALNTRSQSLMTLLSHRANIAESNKQIKQAQDMAKLTRLAFVFVPLSFIASFFGMNLQPLVEQGYQLWLYAAVSLPAVALSIIVMQCNIFSWGERQWKSRRKERDKEKEQ